MSTPPASPAPPASSAHAAVDPGALLAPDDPRWTFAFAVATARTVIEGTRPEQLDAPTPCPDHDVRALTAHLVAVLRRVAAVGRGEPPSSVPPLVDDVADDAFGAAALAAAHEIQEAFTDDVLERPLVLPFATLPGGVALRTFTAEVSVHTWDLAVATGQRPAWSEAAIDVALAAGQVGLPADHRGDGVPFDPVVAVADDAPAIDRLVGWYGRSPAWRPPA